MSEPETPKQDEQDPIVGWAAIAVATGKAINRSVVVKTAQRYASPGRSNRLPVDSYGNGTVYLARADLALFARAWLRARPVGSKPAGARTDRAA